MKHIHFMGIGGSGANAVASIAYSQGFSVSGCDLKESEYTADLHASPIPITLGHDISHLSGVDILCVSPALFDTHPRPEEMKEATRRGITVLTWQEFMGTYLQKSKDVIAIAGTKGKSTTTSLAGCLLEAAGLDPIVEVGAKVINWGKNYRVGKGKYFVCEADEFNNNFHHYHPKIALITNIEMDHPEFFKSEKEYMDSFLRFTALLPANGTLIANADSPGVMKLLAAHADTMPAVLLYGKSAGSAGIVPLSYLISEGHVEFTVAGFESEQTTFSTQLIGEHNISNLCGVVALAKVLNIPKAVVQQFLIDFKGVGRRFELICEKRGIKVYNDYAHNPMSVASALAGARNLYPGARIWAVFQPHMYTRTKMFMDEFAHSFSDATEVILLDIYASREKGLPIAQEVRSQMLADRILAVNRNTHVRAISDKNSIIDVLLAELQPGDVVVNMGAGDNGIITELLSQKL